MQIRGWAVLVVLAALIVGLGAPAEATLLGSLLTAGADNRFEDQSREAYVDANGSGTFNAGDVLLGFIRIDNKTQPNALSLNNQLYAIFSIQVSAIGACAGGGTCVSFAPTTVAGLTLSAIDTSGQVTSATAMAALFTKAGGFSTDLITTSPGNVGTGGAVTLKDYLNSITSQGALELTLDDLAGDFFSTQLIAGVPALATIAAAPGSITIGNNAAGLGVGQNIVGANFQPIVAALDPVTGLLSLHAATVSQSAVSGAFGVTNFAEWTNASELTGLSQCPGACGFTDNGTFTVHPIPQPAPVLLLGVGLLVTLAIARRRAHSRQ